MVEGSVVQRVATLAGNTAINASAPCRSVGALNTSCLSRIESRNFHGDTHRPYASGVRQSDISL